jgi:LemA protein
LKYRKDALVKLVDATKSSIKFEQSTLTEITALRSSKSFNVLEDKAAQQNVALLDKVGSKITATLENYPELHSTETIQQLMTVADYAEREIAASRRLYNATVEEFNVALYQFPTKIVAKHNKLYNLPLFAASATDKQDVSLAL